MHACQPQPWIRWRITSGLEAVALAGYTPEERPVVGTADLYGRAEASCPERVAELAQVRMNPSAMIAAGARGVIYFAWWYAENTLDPAWGESARDTATLITGESGLGHAVVHGTVRRSSRSEDARPGRTRLPARDRGRTSARTEVPSSSSPRSRSRPRARPR